MVQRCEANMTDLLVKLIGLLAAILGAVAGILSSLLRPEILTMLSRGTLRVAGTWTGNGRDRQGFRTSEIFTHDTYTEIVLELKQRGRRVTGTGTVTNEGGQTLSAEVVGQVVDDAHFCFIFKNRPPIRDFGAGVADLDGHVRTMRVLVLGNEVKGP